MTVLRAVLLAACLMPPTGVSAGDDKGPYLGRPIAEIIDAFRNAGQPFAYSTNLVTPDLKVTAEPSPGEPIEIAQQVLEPHGLTIRSEAGVFLVVRIVDSAVRPGRILLMIRAADRDQSIERPVMTVEPVLPAATRIAAGVYQYVDVAPRAYRFAIAVPGFESLSRDISVTPGATAVLEVDLQESPREIESITVSASRYEVASDVGSSQFLMDQRTIRTMPDIGDDPVRVAQRLPGTAASGASAMVHFRGGEEREVGIVLNGQRLFDPFHVRDYQNVFSAIDSRAIGDVEVYTGGFPVRYGDRMSGFILMESMQPSQPRHTEIGVSVFNTSLLLAGRSENRRWLVTARRGNLDLVIDPQFGRPAYYDVFAELSVDLSPDFTLSANALFANDAVTVILESDPAEIEQVDSRTKNAHLWLQLDSRWSDSLSSATVLSAISYRNRRHGVTDDEEKVVASVQDFRDIRQIGFRQDWTWRASDSHLVQWGLSALHHLADFDYAGTAQYFGLPALYQDQPSEITRTFAAAPEGGSYAAWIADRWKLSQNTIVEWGLRWDDQTYTDLPSDSQLSPRLHLLQKLGPRTEFRLSWGRYHQSQGIHELQIEDGITRYWPAQRADQLIAGFRHRLAEDFNVRLELFHKHMRDVRPRFENLFDPLALIPELQPDRIRIDADSARSRGVELSVGRRTGPWEWWAAYTWSKVTDRINGADERRSWDQRQNVQAGIGWSNERWDLNLATGVHSGWPTTDLTLIEEGTDADGEPMPVAVPGPRNSRQHGSFASVDVRASRHFDVPIGSLSAFVEISNVLNRRNDCCLDWDLAEDGSGNEGGLERGLDYWMPLLPAVGVLWEF